MDSDQLLTFLLVEDDPQHAKLIVRSLNKNRVVNRVDQVVDGEQALRYLRAEPPYEDRKRPDVVLLDLNLPKVDGLSVLEAIKTERAELASIPVVILTTSDAETDRARAYQLHANSYVVKPIDFEKFQTMVRDLSLFWGVWNRPPVIEGE